MRVNIELLEKIAKSEIRISYEMKRREIIEMQMRELCPDCTMPSINYQEGCKICYSCGYSPCD